MTPVGSEMAALSEIRRVIMLSLFLFSAPDFFVLFLQI